MLGLEFIWPGPCAPRNTRKHLGIPGFFDVNISRFGELNLFMKHTSIMFIRLTMFLAVNAFKNSSITAL